IINHTSDIVLTSEAIAEIDFAASNGFIAGRWNYIKPEIVDERVIEIKEGRHVVVENMQLLRSKTFTANNLNLNQDVRNWIITGPNMGGKSTFLRQCALIVIMAQAGLFVPASFAKIGVMNSIFSRVGASDNLSADQSTFRVEMEETANILKNADSRSFVIMDEVGRGTSSQDGLALACGIMQRIITKNQSLCLFATHYHELPLLLSLQMNSYKKNSKELRIPSAKCFKSSIVFAEDYARRHGYDFINYAEWNSTLPSNISDLPVYFNKYKAILDMLEVGYDWVLWSDSDSIFMNFSTPILDFADNRFDVIAPTAEPANSIFHGVPNTGHILVKNSAWSKTYFNYLLRQVTEPCDRLPVLNGWLSYCNYYPGSSTFDQFWLTDQGLMGYSWQRWGSDVECHVKKVAFGQFNSEFPWYQEGETVIHFPGRENPQRIKMLGDLLSMLDVETGLLDHSSEHFQFLHPSNLHPDLSVGESKVFMEKMFLDAGMNQPCVGDEGAESILANAFQKTNIKET
ncbi:hypothetical protein HDU82_005523, partial [Entophlyctis luteolus]